MTPLETLGAILLTAFGIAVALFRRYYMPSMPSTDHLDTFPPEPYIPSSVPPIMAPTETKTPPVTNKTETKAPALLWDTPKHSWHSVRVLCDEMGLTFEEKNLICACVYQESRFLNSAVGKNKGSTDWGIVQVNDTKGWHIGKGLQFPSVEYVIANPEACVRWMIRMFKAEKLNLWASYSSGAYQQWLVYNSPMWTLG